jgi:hypothetical protein
VLRYRDQQDPTADELPDDAETFTPGEVPDDVDPAVIESYREDHPDRDGGTFTLETVTCGDDACDCTNGGGLHGPYVYHYYYSDGSLTSDYLGKPQGESA